MNLSTMLLEGLASGNWQASHLSHTLASLVVLACYPLLLSFPFVSLFRERAPSQFLQPKPRTINKQQATIENHVDIPPSQSNIFIYILATHEEEQVFVLFEINILAKKCFIT